MALSLVCRGQLTATSARGRRVTRAGRRGAMRGLRGRRQTPNALTPHRPLLPQRAPPSPYGRSSLAFGLRGGGAAMYKVGKAEIEALTRVIENGALFRYGVGHECETFERRYADYLGVKHFALCASGSQALAAAMIAVGLGPGDEVL